MFVTALENAIQLNYLAVASLNALPALKAGTLEAGMVIGEFVLG
ncbi:MAG: hypothetical protein K0Q85_1307, partial [Caproiciproducens sp.]|nr:hypothetical protein [Caproiciproducens sp.]